MRYRIFMLVTYLQFSLFGCATQINKEMSVLDADAKDSRRSLAISQNFLDTRSDVYVDGKCFLPSLGKKPSPFCESSREAKEFAMSYCALPLGCDLAMALSDNADTFTKRYFSSEACSYGVRKLRGEGYSPDDTYVNLFESVADTMCGNERGGVIGFLGKLVGCPSSASIKFAKVAALSDCIDGRSNRCLSVYKEWKEEPYRVNRECEKNVENVANQTTKLGKITALMEQKKQTFTWRAFGDKSILNDQISDLSSTSADSWLNKNLYEATRWRAQIYVSCLDKGRRCGRVDFRALNCGGKLTYVGASNEAHIFKTRITYGNCVQGCEISMNTDGKSYNELCRGNITGGGSLSD